MNKRCFLILAGFLVIFSGCKTLKATDASGPAVNPDPRLNNIWVVEKVNGRSLLPGDYAKGLPTLEIFVGEQRVGGHDGCNHIGGSFTATEKTISFTEMVSTKMACPGNEKGVQLGTLLNGKTYQYSFGKNCLVFKEDDKEIMLLKNVD
ncbi:MAG: META domain-containing protein [Bacteroidetes bacterium]|nr:META domain-containing protein [Bacteroidota bacterium]